MYVNSGEEATEAITDGANGEEDAVEWLARNERDLLAVRIRGLFRMVREAVRSWRRAG